MSTSQHPPESGSPADWLRYARSDLALARGKQRDDDVLPESLCFHAQQAAEKAIKAVIIHCGGEPPRTHDLRLVLEVLRGRLSVPAEVGVSSELTAYAVQTRYPGEGEPITHAEWTRAVAVAEGVVRWAESIVVGLEGKQ